MNPTPKAAAIHDLSCFGRCSLTVIAPILSTLGIQVCPLPTAVLSTHLGGYRDLEFVDFTDRISPFAAHWKREGLRFDSIYSGFLGSEAQIDHVLEFINDFSDGNPLVLVDPVMGDEGRLYSTYTPKMQERMKQLVQRADIVTPNYTETCFLLGETYEPVLQDSSRVRSWLSQLTAWGPKAAVITGLPLGEGRLLNAGYDRTSDTYWEDSTQLIPVHYPGTGDAYASVLLGSLLHGEDLGSAMQRASAFVATAIRITYAAGTPSREGVLLEQALPYLSRDFWQDRLMPEPVSL